MLQDIKITVTDPATGKVHRAPCPVEPMAATVENLGKLLGVTVAIVGSLMEGDDMTINLKGIGLLTKPTI